MRTRHGFVVPEEGTKWLHSPQPRSSSCCQSATNRRHLFNRHPWTPARNSLAVNHRQPTANCRQLLVTWRWLKFQPPNAVSGLGLPCVGKARETTTPFPPGQVGMGHWPVPPLRPSLLPLSSSLRRTMRATRWGLEAGAPGRRRRADGGMGCVARHTHSPIRSPTIRQRAGLLRAQKNKLGLRYFVVCRLAANQPTSIWQGNWVSVTMGPVSKATQ